MKLLISSNNQDKIKEIRAIFRIPGVELCTLDSVPGAPEVVEDGNTLYDNAFKKASMLQQFSGMPTLADDTGLEVDALDGRPGVYSARFAGENASYDDNVEKLIQSLRHVPLEKRTARFRTVAVFVHPDMTCYEEGVLDGIILTEGRGRRGFGYDPVFYIPAKGKTLAEMTPAEKNAVSHRGQAFMRLCNLLSKQLPSLIATN